MMEKAGRNDPCPCGSGKKYKKCCLPMHEAEERQRAAEQQAERDQRAAAHQASLREARAAMLARAAMADVDDDATNSTLPPTPPSTSSVPASSTKPRAPRAISWNASPICMMGGTASGWSTRPEATIKRPPTATSSAPTPYDDDFEDIFIKRVDKLDPAD
jgi:hypothetical protein